jgi:hypothetical protein
MADVLKFEQRTKARDEAIPIPLRRFLDAVIVPALVREYKKTQNSVNVLAPRECVVANSAASVSLLSEVPR